MQAERLEFCPLPYTLEGPTEYGYGLGIMSFGSWLGHGGSIGGYSSAEWYDPSTGAAISGLEGYQSATIKVWSQVFKRIAEHLYPGSIGTPRYPTC
jgi:D-alanyl-D-alanine carboxypeptidase